MSRERLHITVRLAEIEPVVQRLPSATRTDRFRPTYTRAEVPSRKGYFDCAAKTLCFGFPPNIISRAGTQPNGAVIAIEQLLGAPFIRRPFLESVISKRFLDLLTGLPWRPSSRDVFGAGARGKQVPTLQTD
jgi:hypothetical protein